MNRLRGKKTRTATPASTETRLFGLLARFESQEDLIAAVNQAYDAGYRNFDAYTPYPVEALSRAMRLKPSPLPLVVLAGGIIGGVGAFAMQTFATVYDYPQNIGGRPLFSWPAFIPISFETTILFAALAGILGLFVLTRFPQPYHPVFNSEDFNQHGAQDGFFLGIEASDSQFDLERTRQFIQGLGAVQVSEIQE